ncbi:hypothetical protein [Streptococcus dentiloxodontae]
MKRNAHIVSILLFSVLVLSGCSITKNIVDTATSITDSTSNASASETSSSSTFAPQDTSDETIEEIVTYNDYLVMYSKIIDEYLTNYQNAIAGTVLDDGGTTIENLKQESKNSLEEQRKEYDAMGDSKIVGKDSLVQYLKNYRDSLKEVTDNIASSIQ